MDSKQITLVSSDGEKFQISEKAARKSALIKGVIDDYPDDPEVPLHNVKSGILQKIISYLEYYKDNEPRELERPLPSANFAECVDAWDYQFIELDLEIIFELILAANYMDIRPLMDLSCAKVSSIIKGKSPEEIRKVFNIQNDFTPEEEAQIREENQWCMENL